MRLIVYEVAVHSKNRRNWVQLPCKPWIKDGSVVKDEDSKAKYNPLFEFDTPAVRNAFSDAVMVAVLRFDGRALQRRGAAA
jgi:hypothetical protein